MPFNLKEQLVFYGAYHRNPTNVSIHIICVPLLLFTAFLLGTNTPALATPTLLTTLNLPRNHGTLTAITYATLYLFLSPNIAGFVLAPLILLSASWANTLLATSSNFTYDKTTVNSIAAAVHVVSWIAQFIGHGKYEGRKPALVDNLVQALFLAPLFVWYEVLFLLGFYGELKGDVGVLIEEEVKKMEKIKKEKR